MYAACHDGVGVVLEVEDVGQVRRDRAPGLDQRQRLETPRRLPHRHWHRRDPRTQQLRRRALTARGQVGASRQHTTRPVVRARQHSTQRRGRIAKLHGG